MLGSWSQSRWFSETESEVSDGSIVPLEHSIRLRMKRSCSVLVYSQQSHDLSSAILERMVVLYRFYHSKEFFYCSTVISFCLAQTFDPVITTKAR